MIGLPLLSFGERLIIKVVGEDSSDPLPFSIIRIQNQDLIYTDEEGIASVTGSSLQGKEYTVASYGHYPKKMVIPENFTDTILISLKESPVSLKEAIVRPLKKDKDIKMGRQKLNLGLFNRGVLYAPMNDSTYLDVGDSISGKFHFHYGFEFKTPEKKLFRLRAFGINILPSDSMLTRIDYYISIYDVAGHDPNDTITIPTPIYPPIKVEYSLDQVDKKDRAFRYVFPEPLDLPEEAVVIVVLVNPKENGEYITEGKRLNVLVTKNGKWYEEGNPYKEYNPPYTGKKKYTPYFWEYTQYSLPEIEE